MENHRKVSCLPCAAGQAFLAAVQVTERYPLTGEIREFRRRDLRRGTLPDTRVTLDNFPQAPAVQAPMKS